MSVYTKREGGAWAVKADLYNSRVSKCKIVSETEPVENTQFKNEDGSPTYQDVCKVVFDGQTEALKVALNRATINGLIDAFGGPSSGWQGHELSVVIEKESGKKYPMYLIPEGYEKSEDENGYGIIVKSLPKL